MFVPGYPSPPTARRRGDAPGERPLELVEHELTELCAHLNAATSRWLELLAEFDRRDGWMLCDGCRSCADWLAWRCALTSRAAREHVRVARAIEGLPSVAAAFARGELSYSKVRAITRIATPESEADLLELARHATASQLERMVRAARRVSSEEAAGTHERAYCVWSWDEDGSLSVRAQLPSEDGAALVRALQASRDALNERRWAEEESDSTRDSAAGINDPPDPALRGSAEPQNATSAARRVPWPTGAECLAHVAELALAQAGGPVTPSPRHQVMIHVDAGIGTGAGPGGDGPCHLEDGPGISRETARRLACDSALLRVDEDADGTVLSVGRRTRAVPTALRRALEVRDSGCRFPGCEQRRFADAHHVRHWADGGETSLTNLLLLCRRHHRLVHEAGYTLEGDPGGELVFRNRHGVALKAAPPLPPPRCRPLTKGKVLTGTGERMDFELCVDAVVSAGHWARAPDSG